MGEGWSGGDRHSYHVVARAVVQRPAIPAPGRLGPALRRHHGRRDLNPRLDMSMRALLRGRYIYGAFGRRFIPILGGEFPTLRPLECRLDGKFTFDRRPSRRILSNATWGVGSDESVSVQCATLASSHQPNKRGIAFKCAPEARNARIAASSRHTVRVQDPRSGSPARAPTMNPSDFLVWRADASV